MKKQLFVAAAFMLAVSATTGCEKKETIPMEHQTEQQKESSEQILTKIWKSYDEDQKFFVLGGDNNKENTPAAFDLSKKEEMSSMLTIPESVQEKSDNVASMVHGMNANTFTCSVLQLKEELDLVPAMKVLRDTVLEKQWMCGFPEQLGFAKINDNTLAFVYGNSDSLTYFTEALQKEYPDAEVFESLTLQ